MEKIVNAITVFKNRYESIAENGSAKIVGREEFTLLLSGIATCRKTPGIPVHMGYETLYHCDDEASVQQVKAHLEQMFGVKDKDSLMKACYHIYSGCSEYEQFMTFWNGAPLFDRKQLNEDGEKGFSRCIKLAEYFRPIVGEKGFYAWDINERIGLCRTAAACGIISDEEFWEITDMWVCQAQVFYHSFAEYAVSCLCGAIYEMGRYGDDDLGQFFEINLNVLEHLLEEGGAWQRARWYVPKEREWAVLLDSNTGCIITKKALDTQMNYMYREEPMKEYPDSGWRFFAGDEPEDYIGNSENSSVCALNTICNLYPEIMAFIYAEPGRKFGRHENGWEEET